MGKTRQRKSRLWSQSVDKLCAICGQPMTYNTCDIDHIKPMSKGGQNTRNNIQLTHIYCNRLKADREDFELPADFKLPDKLPEVQKPKPKTIYTEDWSMQRLIAFWQELKELMTDEANS